MARRVIGMTVALGLMSLGPVPLSACAMLVGLPADCAPAVASAHGQSECDQMAMHQPEAQVTHRMADCCKAKAPAQPAVPSAKKVVAPDSTVEPVRTEASVPVTGHSMLMASAPSPPDSHQRQSLLCVFLI